MLRSVKSLEGFAIGAIDGEIGKVKDFYFDDESWAIRYIVVDTGAWLGREILVSPYSVGEPSWAANVLPVNVSKEQIKNSPNIDTDKPISRQHERSYLGYYGYPYYWGSANSWGAKTYPGPLLTGIGAGVYPGYLGHLKAPSDDAGADPHLRSCDAVKGYHIHAEDGEIGHVQGFIVDDYTWSIRYLVVNTSNWWIGHDVLISPEWIQYVSWTESTVGIELDRRSIQDAPSYHVDASLDRDAEVTMYRHYDRPGYWHGRHPDTVESLNGR
jgi:hypothetical protein